MPRYKIVGKGTKTGRSRTRTYSAKDEVAARAMATADETTVETIHLLPPDPPTERQLAYAETLGIAIPHGASKDDLIVLISDALDDDEPSSALERSYADAFGIEYSEKMGKEALFNWIHSSLSVPGRETELLAWFIFCVYRQLTKRSTDAAIKGPADPTILSIATQLATDRRIVKSARGYEGRELIRFGEWTAPDGYGHSGGSKGTIAFKEASSRVRSCIELPKPIAPPIPAAVKAKAIVPAGEPSTSLPIVAIVAIVGVVAILLLLAIR